MRNDRETAFKLRLSGRSYSEIRRSLGVPKSTLSGWFSDLQLSEHLRNRIIARAHKKSVAALLRRNKMQTTIAVKRKSEIINTARQEIHSLTKDNIFFIGAALYWAEGYKRPQVRNGRELTSHSVSFTNSDPGIVLLFLRFLREVCEVPNEKIKADIRIYQHLNTDETLKYWAKITKVQQDNFGKVYYGVSKSSLGKRPYNRLPFGTIQIRVNNTKLFHRIMGWIEGLKKFC